MASLTSGLQLLATAVRYALASTELVAAPLLSRPTPCAGWDLELLLDHVSESADVMHHAITAGRVALGPLSGNGPPKRDPVGGLHEQTTRLLAACAAGRPTHRAVAIGDRALTTSMVAIAGALELTVHGWDISVACDACRPVPPDLAAILLPLAPLLITAAARPGLFADPVSAPPDASAGDQLVAFLGRQPRHPAVTPTA